MGSNQNPWTPNKDCSLGICTIYCPQFCYFIFPPPPPDDDYSTTAFSPVIIAIIGVLAGAFILVSYYTIATRCRRRNPNTIVGAEELHREAAAANGLEEAVIKTITVCNYREGDGLIEGNECAVCLSEFQENEALRLLPKCSHAFHLPCIDTWLKSHSNCPLCRAGVMSSPHPLPPSQALTNMDSDHEFDRPRELVIMVDDRDAGGGGSDAMLNQGDEEGVSHLRRSVSLGTLPSQRRRLVSDSAKIDGVKGQSWREIGSSNLISELVNSNCKGKNTMLLPD